MKTLRSFVTTVVGCCLLFITSGFDSYHHAPHNSIPKLNYDSLFSQAIDLSQSQAGQRLVDRCLKKYGGLDKLNQLHSLKVTYSMLPFRAKDSVTVIKYLSTDRKYAIVRREPNLTERRILNGPDAWLEAHDTAVYLYSGRYKAELFSYLTLSMPQAIRSEPFSAIRFGYRDKDSLNYLYMKKDDSLMIILGIDPDDFTIRSSEGVIYQDSNTFVFINAFSEFHVYDGYLLPSALVNISMGLAVAHSHIQSVEINPELTEDEFRPSIPPNAEPY